MLITMPPRFRSVLASGELNTDAIPFGWTIRVGAIAGFTLRRRQPHGRNPIAFAARGQ